MTSPSDLPVSSRLNAFGARTCAPNSPNPSSIQERGKACPVVVGERTAVADDLEDLHHRLPNAGRRQLRIFFAGRIEHLERLGPLSDRAKPHAQLIARQGLVLRGELLAEGRLRFEIAG